MRTRTTILVGPADRAEYAIPAAFLFGLSLEEIARRWRLTDVRKLLRDWLREPEHRLLAAAVARARLHGARVPR